jgi:hypothetical protein
MRRLLFAVVLIGLGCTAAPEKTCEQMLGLRRADAQARGKPFTPEREAQVRDKCLAEMREMDGRDRDAYVCAADCIRRANEAEIATICVNLCDYKKKQIAKPAPASSIAAPLPATP